MNDISKLDGQQLITDAVAMKPEHIQAIAQLSKQTGYSKADIIAACLDQFLGQVTAALTAN
jgi:hypothetical protein